MLMRLYRGLFLLWAALLVSTVMAASAIAAGYEAIEIVPTRPDVTVRLLVMKANSKPSTALLLFPGSDGTKHFGEKDGRFWASKNFLMRIAGDLASAGYIAVAVDAPSDQSYGMSDLFRTSPQHAKDIQKIIAYLKEKHRVTSLHLVGTSRGTISAAYLASVLDEPALASVILTAVYPPADLGNVDLTEIDDPVLIVHHVFDDCRLTPYHGAMEWKARLTESPMVNLVGVTGVIPPASGPCDALSNHGFFGMDKPVVKVITNWLTGKPVPERISK